MMQYSNTSMNAKDMNKMMILKKNSYKQTVLSDCQVQMMNESMMQPFAQAPVMRRIDISRKRMQGRASPKYQQLQTFQTFMPRTSREMLYETLRVKHNTGDVSNVSNTSVHCVNDIKSSPKKLRTLGQYVRDSCAKLRPSQVGSKGEGYYHYDSQPAYRYVSPLYSSVIDCNLIHKTRTEYLHARDFDCQLFKKKLSFFRKDYPDFKFISYDFHSIPFFIWKAEKESISPMVKSITSLIQNQSIDHYVSTHPARRMFLRMNDVFHIHRDLYEIMFPMGFRPSVKERTLDPCKYDCREFYQSCKWHEDMDYDPVLSNTRRYLADLLWRTGLSTRVEFWVSLVMVYNDFSYLYGDPLAKERTLSIILSANPKRSELLALLPDCRYPNGYVEYTEPVMIAQARRESEATEDIENAIAEANEDDESGIVEELGEMVSSQYAVARCVPCDLAFMWKADYEEHLQSLGHRIKEKEASADSNPISYTRGCLMDKLSEVFNAMGELSEAMPRWLKDHVRFITNLVCNCVSMIFAKSWVSILATLGALVNEIYNEFPDVFKDKVQSLMESLKKVMWRFFPQAQAQPTTHDDNVAANESFVSSLFGIIGSFLPGVRVEAGLLKARIQRIQSMSCVLNAARTVGDWICLLFDKIWTWIQIYWYGATSEELARSKGLISNPELTLWIRDVEEFEYGGKKGVPGSTKLLTDKEAQKKVIELKKKGEQFVETLSTTDTLINTKLMNVLRMNLTKLERWFKIFEDSVGLTNNKHEPFVLYIHGKPGIGKTFLINHICHALAALVGKEFDPAADIFAKPRSSEYHDGYTGQFCVVLDDYMQVADQNTNTEEISFIIDAGSRAKLHLNMSESSRKALAYFDSPLIIMTANKALSPGRFGTKLDNFPAFARRVDAVIEMRRQENWEPDPALTFDPSGLFFDVSYFVCDSKDQNGGNFEKLSDVAYDWDALIKALGLMFVIKLKRQAALDEPIVGDPILMQEMNTIVSKYSDLTGRDKDIVRYMFNQEATVTPYHWGSLACDAEERYNDKPIITTSSRSISAYTSEGGSRRSTLSSRSDLTNFTISRSSTFSSSGSAPLHEARSRASSTASMIWEKIKKKEVTLTEQEKEKLHLSKDRGVHFKYTPEAKAQARTFVITCPASMCTGMINEETTRLDYMKHLIFQVLDRNEESHRQLTEQDIWKVMKMLRTTTNERLSAEDVNYYRWLQALYGDYKVEGIDVPFSVLNFYCETDILREMIKVHRERIHLPWYRAVVALPSLCYQGIRDKINRTYASCTDMVSNKAQMVKQYAKEALGKLEALSKSIRSVAIAGVVLTVAGSVVTMCYLKWTKNGNSEGFGGSASNKTMTRRKRAQRIESNFTGARKECLYKSNTRILPVCAARARISQPGEPVDLWIYADRDTVQLRWRDGEHKTLENLSNFERDVEIGTFIDMKLSSNIEALGDPISAKMEERYDMVRKAISSIPLKFEDLQHSEAARDTEAMRRLEVLQSNVCILSNPADGLSLNGVFLRDNIIMVPLHLLCDRDPKGLQIRITTSSDSQTGILGKDWKYYIADDKDTIFIDVSKTKWAGKKNIIKFFIQDADEITARSGYLLIPGLRNKTDMHYIYKGVNSFTLRKRFAYRNVKDTKLITIIDGLTYSGDTEPGDCGSILVAVDRAQERKLLGIHVAGEVGLGTSVLWTQEKLNESLSHFQLAQGVIEASFAPLELDDFFETNREERGITILKSQPIGMLKEEYIPFMPRYSKVKPSILAGIIETKSAPAHLIPFEDTDGQIVSPLKRALEKLESPMIRFDQSLLDDVTRRMVVDYGMHGWLKPSANDSMRRGKLSTEENLLGDSLNSWIKPINMHTSPGYPYNLVGGKSAFLDPEEKRFHSILRDAIKRREKLARQGVAMPALIVDCLKDERLPSEKVAIGKTRIFNVCPLDYNYLVRKYFTRFLAKMMEKHLVNEVSVGINPHNDEWKIFYENLRKRGDYWVAGDYSAWDKRAPYQIAMSALELVEAFYKQFDDYEATDAVVRRVLIDQAYRSTRMAVSGNKGLVYQVHQSMPSGIAVTAVYNSIVNALLFRIIFAELAMQSGWEKVEAINSYHKFVAFAAYGDDHVVRVSSAVAHFFNMLAISEQMKKHHITYTSTMKGDVKETFVSDEDLTYLKRRFVRRMGALDAPMDEEAVIDILNWIHESKHVSVRESVENSVRSVLIELSHHERRIFDKWYKKIFSMCIAKGLDCPVTSYSEVRADRVKMDFYFEEEY